MPMSCPPPCWPGRGLVLAVLLLPLGCLIAALVVYVFRRRVLGDAPEDEELAARGRSAILGHTLRQGFAWAASPIEGFLLSRRVTPDTLSVTGGVVCCVGGLLLAGGDLTVGGLLVLASAAFDFFDGRIARRSGLSSRAGEFLDSTLDRYSDAFCFGAAAFLFRARPVLLAIALLAFGAAAVVPYARAKAASLGVELKSGLMQRPERLVLFGAAAVFGGWLDRLWPEAAGCHPTFAAAIWFLGLATAATAMTRTRDGRRLLSTAPSVEETGQAGGQPRPPATA